MDASGLSTHRVLHLHASSRSTLYCRDRWLCPSRDQRCWAHRLTFSLHQVLAPSQTWGCLMGWEILLKNKAAASERKTFYRGISVKISLSLGRETIVGRKSESLSSLFQGLIRHLGISTSAPRAQLGGKGLGFVRRSGERPFCWLPSCCLKCFALSCEQACWVLRWEAYGQLRALGSRERLRLAGEAPHHRQG